MERRRSVGFDLRAMCYVAAFVMLAASVQEASQAATESKSRAPRAREVIIAVDISGSMRAGQKWKTAQELMRFIVNATLSDGDRCVVFVFGTDIRKVGEFTMESQRPQLQSALSSLQPIRGGYTNIERAKATAVELLAQAQNRDGYLFLITDDLANKKLPSSDSLFNMWQREKQNLKFQARFGQMGVDLIVLGYRDAGPFQRKKIIIKEQANCADEVKKLGENAVLIALRSASLVNGRHQLGRVRGGQTKTAEVEVSSFLPSCYLRGAVSASLAELGHGSGGRLTGQAAPVEMVGGEIELPPRPQTPANAQPANAAGASASGPAGSADSGSGEETTPPKTVGVSLRFPATPWAWQTEHVIDGTLEVTVKGKLSPTVSSGGLSTNAHSVDLPPIVASFPFSIIVRDDVTRPYTLAALLALLLAAAAGLACLYALPIPVTLVLESSAASQRRTYRLGTVRLGGATNDPNVFPLPEVTRPLAKLSRSFRRIEIEPQGSAAIRVNEQAVTARRPVGAGDRIDVSDPNSPGRWTVMVQMGTGGASSAATRPTSQGW